MVYLVRYIDNLSSYHHLHELSFSSRQNESVSLGEKGTTRVFDKMYSWHRRERGMFTEHLALCSVCTEPAYQAVECGVWTHQGHPIILCLLSYQPLTIINTLAVERKLKVNDERNLLVWFSSIVLCNLFYWYFSTLAIIVSNYILLL